MSLDQNAPTQPGTLAGAYSMIADMRREIESLAAVRTRLGDNSVTGAKISFGQISADHLQAGSVQAGHIEAGSIHTVHLAAGAVDASVIAAFAVQTTHLAANSVTADKLATTLTISSTIQTGTAGSRVVLDANGLRGYDTLNAEKFRFDTATGSLTLDGVITARSGSAVPVTYVTSGNIVSGTIITIDSGGYLRTNPTNPMVKLDNAGLHAYNGAGQLTADIAAASSTFTGGTFQTAAPGTANRVVMDSSGLKAYGGVGQELTEKVNISSGTATITGGTFQTAPALSPNRVVMDSTGIKAYGADGTTATVTIAGGSATITAGTIEGATFKTSSSGNRVQMDAGNNQLFIYSGGTQVTVLDPSKGLGFVQPDNNNPATGRAVTWRADVPNGTLYAGITGARFTGNWTGGGNATENHVNVQAVGAAISERVITNIESWYSSTYAGIYTVNEPQISPNARRVELWVANDGNTGSWNAKLRSSDGSWACERLALYSGRIDGQIGINGYAGNIAPLAVNGQSRLDGSTSIGKQGAPGYTADVNGTCHATSFPVSSDIRLKEKVADLLDARTLVRKLRPVTFEWKRESVDGGARADASDRNEVTRRQVGFIAQDVLAVAPDFVTQSLAPEGIFGLDYSRMIPLLTRAAQEQDEELTALRAENEAQRKTNVALLTAIERLEARLGVVEKVPPVAKALAH